MLCKGPGWFILGISAILGFAQGCSIGGQPCGLYPGKQVINKQTCMANAGMFRFSGSQVQQQMGVSYTGQIWTPVCHYIVLASKFQM